MCISSRELLVTWFYHLSQLEGGGEGSSHWLPWSVGRIAASLCIRAKIRSQTLRQQLVKYAVKFLSGKDWEMAIFVCSLC